MFVYFSKLLPLLVYPLGLACLLIIGGLMLSRKPAGQRLVLLAALLLLLLGSNQWVAMGLARSLEWRYLPQGELPAAGAIVVLGGGTDPWLPPRPMVELNGSGDRLLYAAQLYRQGKSEHVLLSGGRLAWREIEMSQAEEMAELLAWMGVPAEALWLEEGSRNTHENAANSRQILAANDIERILLVTSASHMPRAVALFEAQGLEVVPAPVDFTVTHSEWQQMQQAGPFEQLLYLLPDVSNLALTTRILKEYIGLLMYGLIGWT